MVAGLAAWAANVWLRPALGLEWDRYSRYVAPVVEESLKAAFVVWLLRRNKVGFVVDAAIHGFGIGTGFAFLENLYYLQANPGATFWSWVVRGLGTAIMHGGATSIVAMVSRALHNRSDPFRPWLVLPGLGVAVVLHSLYNHFLLQPDPGDGADRPGLSLPLRRRVPAQRTRDEGVAGHGVRHRPGAARVVRSGQLSATPVGSYLRNLRSRFSAEAIVDMMCLLRLRAELAIKAKGVLMMREAGFDAAPDPTLKERFEELRYLERSIGKTGLLALDPFLHTGTRDLWQLTVLNET